MDVEEININALRKLRLTGAILVAYSGEENTWFVSQASCDKYGLYKIMDDEALKTLERSYGTKIVRVTAVYENGQDKNQDALIRAGYGE